MNTLRHNGAAEVSKLPPGASLRRSHEEWLATETAAPQPVDYEIRRAQPGDLPRIYQLLDTVWERNQPREVYDWLYLHNPAGAARCSYMVERSTGEIISTVAGFPWPIAYGDHMLDGLMGGDSATIPRLQRCGLSQIRREYAEQHPFYDSFVSVGIPNFKSRALARKYGRNIPFGPLRYATLIIDWARYLRTHAIPAAAAVPLGVAASQGHRLWHVMHLGRRSGLRVEEISRFESDADPLVYACTRSDRYWCYHDAGFLNWRYFRHPRFSYLARGVYRGDELCGFGVLRVDRGRGMIMELVAPPRSPDVARAVLGSLIHTARGAGCDRLDVYATCTWRYWDLVSRSGFRDRDSKVYVSARLGENTDVTQEENWTLLPGDSDVT